MARLLASRPIAAIEQQAENRRAMKILKGDAWKNELDLIFTTESGRPLRGSVVTRKFQERLEKAGLRHRRFHELRHGFATLLLSQGVDMRVVMELMGHTQISTSLIYTHVVPALLTDAARKLGDAIG